MADAQCTNVQSHSVCTPLFSQIASPSPRNAWYWFVIPPIGHQTGGSDCPTRGLLSMVGGIGPAACGHDNTRTPEAADYLDSWAQLYRHSNSSRNASRAGRLSRKPVRRPPGFDELRAGRWQIGRAC